MAAGNIPDQNIVKYKLDRGLWEVDSTGSSPPDESFSKVFTNLYVKADGSLQVRPTSYPWISFNAATQAATLKVPLKYTVGLFSNTAPAKALVFDPEYNYSTTPKRAFVISQPGSGNTNAFANIGNYFITDFVEYNGTIYFSTPTNGVYKITTFTWPGPTITPTAVASSPNLDGMIFFKSRLFGFKGSTIYFTDVTTTAAPNPETWATSVNTVIINSTGATPKIYKLMVFNDRLMIFTDNGLYTLSIQGQPASWLLKPLDLAIQVNSFECAVEYRGHIYFVDATGVWMTNGSSSQLISEPIKYNFIYSTFGSSFRILRVGSFLMVYMAYTTVFGGVQDETCYYTSFDNLGSWGKYQGGDTGMLPIASLNKVPLTTNTYANEAVLLHEIGGSNFVILSDWQAAGYLDDYNRTALGFTLTTSDLAVGSDIEDKYVKYGYMVLNNEFNGGSMSINVNVNGTEAIIPTTYGTGTLTGQRVIKFEVGVRVRRLTVSVSYAVPTGPGAIIEGLYFVVGTERTSTEKFEF